MLNCHLVINQIHARWLCPLALVLTASLSGCTYSPVTRPRGVTVRDGATPLYVATAIIRHERWRATNPHHGTGGIEFGYEHQSGVGRDQLIGLSFITLNSVDGASIRITGPQTLRYSASANHEHIAYNYLLTFKQHFELEPAIGIAYDALNLRVFSGTDGAYVDTSRKYLGISLGVTPRWKFDKHFAIEGRIRYGAGSGYTNSYYPAVVYSPIRNARISVGYAWRAQLFQGSGASNDLGPTNTNTSNIVFRCNGPALGVQMTF